MIFNKIPYPSIFFGGLALSLSECKGDIGIQKVDLNQPTTKNQPPPGFFLKYWNVVSFFSLINQ